MPPGDRMSPQERRAVAGLAGIFGLRMLGMFAILPVFAIYAEGLPGGGNLALAGVAIGIYGFTQAILQLPFGAWSDRYGRKPVICVGLGLFALGSFVAAAATSIWIVILGRALQGAGAISAAVVAMVADLTRDSQRTKAMAMIGATIGVTFAASLVLSPWLARVIGVPGIFALTGGLALVALWMVVAVLPDAPVEPRRAGSGRIREAVGMMADPQLARLYYGIFALHAVLTALFLAVPFELRSAGLPVHAHWQVYLPVMLGSFLLMLPAVLVPSGAARVKVVLTAAVAALLVNALCMPLLGGGVWPLAVFLLVFFTAFNVLEATLPSLVSRMAPRAGRGAAIGVFTSLQFLGAFLGAVAGGYSYGRWGVPGVTVFCACLISLWLIAVIGTRVPQSLPPRAYAVPPLDGGNAEPRVDSTRGDEHNVASTTQHSR
jgi:MFS family permease